MRMRVCVVHVVVHVVVHMPVASIAPLTPTPARTRTPDAGRECVAARLVKLGSGMVVERAAGRWPKTKAPGQLGRRARVSRFSTCLTWLQ